MNSEINTKEKSSSLTSDATVPFRAGFSLVELMVVIVIIGLLAGVVTFSVRTQMIRSKQNIAKVEISKMMQAMESFYADNDRYPTNEEGLKTLVEETEQYPAGLLSKISDDPWGNPYEYHSPGRDAAFDIISYGADHREGGSGADKDIRSDEIGS